MLGNQLNPASTMAQKMSDTLSQELSEAHSIFSTADSSSVSGTQLIGPQLHSRVIACVSIYTITLADWNVALIVFFLKCYELYK